MNLNNRYNNAFRGAVPPRLPIRNQAPTMQQNQQPYQPTSENDGFKVVYNNQEQLPQQRTPVEPVYTTGDPYQTVQPNTAWEIPGTSNPHLDPIQQQGYAHDYVSAVEEAADTTDKIAHFASIDARLMVLLSYREHMQELVDSLTTEIEQATAELQALEDSVHGKAVKPATQEPKLSQQLVPVNQPLYAHTVQQMPLHHTQYVDEYGGYDPQVNNPAMGFINSIIHGAMQAAPHDGAIRVQMTRIVPQNHYPSNQYGF